jgi:hypothetical protein
VSPVAAPQNTDKRLGVAGIPPIKVQALPAANPVSMGPGEGGGGGRKGGEGGRGGGGGQRGWRSPWGEGMVADPVSGGELLVWRGPRGWGHGGGGGGVGAS